jgi:predicted amidohydrolase
MSMIFPPIETPQKQPIETLFNAMCHGKRNFSDFSNAAVALKNVRCQAFFDVGRNAKTLYKATV